MGAQRTLLGQPQLDRAGALASYVAGGSGFWIGFAAFAFTVASPVLFWWVNHRRVGASHGLSVAFCGEGDTLLSAGPTSVATRRI
jgi:hypothetical protein